MTPRSRLPHVVAALVLAIAFVAVASSGVAEAGDADKDLERVTESDDELAKAGSAKFQGTSSGDDGKVTFDGSFNFQSRAGEYKVDVAAIGLQGSGKVRALLIGGVQYLSLDSLDSADPSAPELVGKLWLKLDPALFGGDGQIGQSDPNGSLDALRGVTGGVKRVGTERVRGTRTTRYRVTIDVEQAVAYAPEDRRDEVRRGVGSLGSGTIPADVWIDNKGRLRKEKLHVAGSSTRNKGSVAFEYFDLGAPSNVEEPPASEVVDFFQLLGGTTPTTG
jgi:hypothetical protein